jgi:cyclopropane fatty-acyl-phospholipid synthase-like methyltransferase
MLESVRSILSIPAVYQLWGNMVGGSSSIRTLVNEYIQPNPDSRILEIGCGPGTMVPFLPQSGYLGFDLSSEYIDEARRHFPTAKFVCERVSKFSLAEDHSFDIVLAIGILHHLDNAEATQLFQIAHDALRPGGKLVTVDGVFTDDQSAAARWLLKKDRGGYVRRKEEYLALASRVFANTKPAVRQDLLRIPYTHLILQCLRPVLSVAGKTA